MDTHSFPAASSGDPSVLYLDLLKRCLTNWIYADVEARLVPPAAYSSRARTEGRDWPLIGHTMIGVSRLDNIQTCIEAVIRDRVPGDLLEAGVWRGGAAIFMRAILKARGVTDRCVWLADSFQGVPPSNPVKYPHDAGLSLHQFPQLAVPLEEVRDNFARYGLLDDRVRFLPGWFRDSLPTAPVERLAVLRLDGDLYESTMDTLTHLYPKVAPGGFVIVDDYGAIEACRQAVHDYRAAHGILEPIVPVDWSGVYWRRSG